MAEVEERAHKKRRFFVDDEAVGDATLSTETSLPDEIDAVPEANGHADSLPVTNEQTDVFDVETLKAVVGEDIPDHAVRSLQGRFGSNVEQAINAYFDGSWKTPSPQKKPAPPAQHASQKPLSFKRETSKPHIDGASSKSASSTPPPPPALATMPAKRYIGALGVAGWTTRSGLGLLKPGDLIKIERTKQQVPQKAGRSGKLKQVVRRTQDVIVRFTNIKGEEVGRLEKETAMWISALLDQKVCVFEGHCIFAPERVRTNDTVYLQLRCYLLKQAFEASNFVKPSENNRETGIFEAKETQDERDLRIRQIGLVKLFSEINLQPSKVNETTARHKREGILQAAEVAEQYDQQQTQDSGTKKGKSGTPPEGTDGSSPPASEEIEKEEGEELEQDQLDSLYKKAQSFDFNTPEAQPAETFRMDLRKYQKQALHWMLKKETSSQSQADYEQPQQQSMHPLWEEYLWPTKDAEDKDLSAVNNQPCFYVNPYSGELSLDFPVQEHNCLGGILADEMGLGKTIEMLALIHSHTSPEQQALSSSASNALDSVNSLPRLPKTTNAIEHAPATTLVIAPMSLLAQWASEAEKASLPGTLKTLVYYGSEKAVNLQTICSTSNLASAPNVIITSYGTVLSEHTSPRPGGLFSLEYFRIILDEAHMIKNRSSKTAKACYELQAVHRWTLTGTPIVNRLEDLFSLVRFLRVEPWSNFSFWKTFITAPFEKGDFVQALDVVQTVLEPLVLRRTKDMKTPDGQMLVPLPKRTIEIERVQLSAEEKEVYGLVFARAKRTFRDVEARGELMRSYTAIFAVILRLRQCCCHPVLTRSKQIVEEEEAEAGRLDEVEGLADDMDLATLLQKFEADAAESLAGGGGTEEASKFGAHVLKQIQEEAEMECPICAEEPMVEQCVVSGCWHGACKKCLLGYIEREESKGELARCFNCREPVCRRDVFEVVREEVDEEEEAAGVLAGSMDVDVDVDVEGAEQDLSTTSQPAKPSTPKNKPAPRISLRRVTHLSSAKITTLLSQLKSLRKVDRACKSVIFSQFTSFLDLIAPALTAANIPWLRFDGSLSQKERARILADFANRTGFTVLLLSLRAGGVGLNLTCAKRVWMMDPWWSWAVEAQAIDRVHRMGQTEEVKVVRLVVEGSIEEKMLRVQERKRFM